VASAVGDDKPIKRGPKVASEKPEIRHHHFLIFGIYSFGK
jgi:hypothetical protein